MPASLSVESGASRPRPDAERGRGYVVAAVAVVLASAALRVALVLSGGQYYWPDELRYESSRRAAEALRLQDWQGVVEALHQPDYPLFRTLGVLPALLEDAAAPDPRIAAGFFATFSLASLWLTWALVRRLGESRRVAFFALTLLAGCSTFFYYGRHVVPYDLGMALGLSALCTGLQPERRVGSSLLCGALAGAAFLAYSGYWTLAALSILAHTLVSRGDRATGVRRAVASGGAFLVPVAGLYLGDIALGGDLLPRFIAFTRTVKQGLSSEGWSLPFAYLWHAEHGITVLWAAAAAWAAWRFSRGERRPALTLALAGCVFVYGCLAIFSTGLGLFVVYGRLVRQMVPFLCVLAALLLDSFWAQRRERRAALVLCSLVGLQAAGNVVAPLRTVFPDEFRRLATRACPELNENTHEFVNAEHIYPIPSTRSVRGRTILERPHPLSFVPFQYEGYTPRQRASLRSWDIRMRLVQRPGSPAPR